LILWRAVRRAFAGLSGQGGLFHSGRWHMEGRLIVHTAEHPALALLEVRVNLDLPGGLVPDDYVMMKISAPDALQALGAGSINPADTSASQTFGDNWRSEGRSALLKVPSAIALESVNFLINPQHADFSKIRIESIFPFAFDQRQFA
jgi:RES domain-containing protein